MAGRWAIGQSVPSRELTTITDARIPVPDPDRLTHLQFRRFAGCPVCNLHLHSVVQRHAEITAAGVREVVFFHAPDAELRRHAADLPFDVIADPDKRYYTEFGVEYGRRALLNPRAWGPILRALARSVPRVLTGREKAPAGVPHGGRLGLPADFLIAPSGRLLAAKYGEHAYDQWSVDELLALAEHAPQRAARRP